LRQNRRSHGRFSRACAYDLRKSGLGDPIILYREDLSLEQRAKHVRYLLARLREPWGGALLLQDPALLLDSPEYR